MLEPLSGDTGNAQLRACLEGSTQRGTQAPGGGKRGIGKRGPTEGDNEREKGVVDVNRLLWKGLPGRGCRWTPQKIRERYSCVKEPLRRSLS